MREVKSVIVPIKDFQQPVKDMIEKFIGKNISIEEFLLMDPIKIGIILEYTSLCYMRYKKALVSGILNKHNKAIKGT